MKKIIFTNLVMQEPFLCKYEVDNSKELEYEHKVFFPINAILAKTLNKCDDVKVVIIKRDNIANNNEKNEKLLKDELNKINEKIGANITYKTLNYEYVEKISIHEKIIKDLIDEIEENAHILADITYGPKPQMISIFTALRFAEKFFNCEVDSIIYGKTELQASDVVATDLRAGACLVLAGLTACGVTTISKIEHVLRGYENIIEKLQAVGAKIEIEEI